MGAGASTEGGFGVDDVLGDGDPVEITADEGYDSDLAGDLKDLFTARVKKTPGNPTVDCSRGRLGKDPIVGGAANALPCASAIHAPLQYPATHPPDAEKRPEDELRLEFVHGYRAHDVRANLAYDKSGRLCYHAAALGRALSHRASSAHLPCLHTLAFHHLRRDAYTRRDSSWRRRTCGDPGRGRGDAPRDP